MQTSNCLLSTANCSLQTVNSLLQILLSKTRSFVCMKEAFTKIIPHLSAELSNIGSAILINGEKIPLSKEYFKLLTANCELHTKILFVDGGSGLILKSASSCLQFIRLYAVLYEKNKRTKQVFEEYLVAIVNKADVLEASVFDAKGNFKTKKVFGAFDPELTINERLEPERVCSLMLKLLELNFAFRTAKELNPNTLIRDGDLVPTCFLHEHELKNLRSLFCIVLGLSKTSRLCTNTGVSVVTALQRVAPDGCWLYKTNTQTNFIKLHPKSKYVFRCDSYVDPEAAVSSLIPNSSDPVFLGYPYGLLDADKFAQVTKSELSQLRVQFALHSKELFSETDLNAHDILDVL